MADPLDTDDPRHGTRNGYVTYKCRCLACTKADSEYHRARYRVVKNGPPLPAADPRHGTRVGYFKHHCRCSVCMAAMRRTRGDRG